MHYVRDIFEEKKTQHSHNKFVRYSKGEFVGPLMKIKFGKNNVKISGSFHYVDELIELIAQALDNREVEIRGSLIWNRDLTEDLAKLGIKYVKVTKSRGIFKYALENVVKMREFVDLFNEYNLLINVKSDDVSLVTKSAFPKPNKEFSHDFCKVILPADFAETIMKEFAFDVKNEKLKDIEIKHKIFIENIHLPKTDNFEEARRLATREGRITRSITVNGEDEKNSEIQFNI